MKNLTTELNRLYFVSDAQQPGEATMRSRDGSVKAMVLELSGPADWRVLSAVWHGVQQDLDLPAPAIAVSGSNGLQLWFSIDESAPVIHAIGFLKMLVLKYLGGVARNRINCFPAEGEMPGTVVHASQVPEQQGLSGNWSAFIHPDLASIFGSEPWLDVQPNPEAQAEILRRLRSMKFSQFQKLTGQRIDLDRGLPDQDHEANPEDEMKSYCDQDAGNSWNLGQLKPKGFLENVMRDPKVPLLIRVEAAKALLPYSG